MSWSYLGQFQIWTMLGQKPNKAKLKENLVNTLFITWACWNPHVRKSAKRLIPNVHLKQISYFISFEIRKVVYNAYIESLLDYCCHVWGTCQRKNAMKINKLQKRAVRLVLNEGKRWNSNCILQSMGWLNFFNKCRYHTAFLIHKTINSMTPCYMNDVITTFAHR